MATSASEARQVPLAQSVSVTEDELVILLLDGRTLSIPLAWYPRLLHGTQAEREKWELIGRGIGVHFPDLDEDISIEHALDGVPSGENADSLRRWMDSRRDAAQQSNAD